MEELATCWNISGEENKEKQEAGLEAEIISRLSPSQSSTWFNPSTITASAAQALTEAGAVMASTATEEVRCCSWNYNDTTLDWAWHSFNWPGSLMITEIWEFGPPSIKK